MYEKVYDVTEQAFDMEGRMIEQDDTYEVTPKQKDAFLAYGYFKSHLIERDDKMFIEIGGRKIQVSRFDVTIDRYVGKNEDESEFDDEADFSGEYIDLVDYEYDGFVRRLQVVGEM